MSCENCLSEFISKYMELIFPLFSGVLLIAALIEFSRFFLTHESKAIINGIIASASAITLVGLHRGIEMLINPASKWSPVTTQNLWLYVLVIAGGLFVLAALILKPSIIKNDASLHLSEKLSLDAQSLPEKDATSGDATISSSCISDWSNKLDEFITGKTLDRLCSYGLLCGAFCIFIIRFICLVILDGIGKHC